MKTLLGVYPLRNCHTGEYEDAQLYTPIDEKNITDFESQWRPIIDERIANLAEHEDRAAANVQDAHWKWREKTGDRTPRLDYASFSIECNGVTQGLMFLRTIAFAKEASQANQHIIYVDLVSTAPWNRPGFTDNRQYEGVGPLFLATAISYSIEQGFKGRIGLHSLPQSESWYRNKCGMTDLGSDPASQNLTYFEMTPEQAHNYINT